MTRAASLPKRQTDPNHWTDRITAAWRKSVEAIFETGRLLGEAKDALDQHGEWLPMVRRLPFSEDTAQRLMAIARDQRLAEHVRLLPPSWGTLYQLSRLDDATFAKAIEAGDIHSEMEREDAVRLRQPRVEPPALVEVPYVRVETPPEPPRMVPYVRVETPPEPPRMVPYVRVETPPAQPVEIEYVRLEPQPVRVVTAADLGVVAERRTALIDAGEDEAAATPAPAGNPVRDAEDRRYACWFGVIDELNEAGCVGLDDDNDWAKIVERFLARVAPHWDKEDLTNFTLEMMRRLGARAPTDDARVGELEREVARLNEENGALAETVAMLRGGGLQ
jgi:hypothetical protein